MKTWGIVVGLLISLFCPSYMVRHPGAVNQTLAKVFPHERGRTPHRDSGAVGSAAARRWVVGPSSYSARARRPGAVGFASCPFLANDGSQLGAPPNQSVYARSVAPDFSTSEFERRPLFDSAISQSGFAWRLAGPAASAQSRGQAVAQLPNLAIGCGACHCRSVAGSLRRRSKQISWGAVSRIAAGMA
jgi:hypothetical protein